MTGPILTVSGLGHSFGGLKVIKELSFEVPAGAILGLLGPNGSGKTTALNLISGAIQAHRGSVKLDGREIARLPAHEIARAGLARTFQLVRVFRTMTVAENVRAGLAFAGAERLAGSADEEIARLLAMVGLDGRLDVAASNLTYIDQKRLELARALATQPRLLLLDEWLAGLNPTELAVGLDLIRGLQARKLSVVMVEHVMHAIRAVCDRCIVMNAGEKIAEGSTEDVLKDPLVISAYLGDDHV